MAKRNRSAPVQSGVKTRRNTSASMTPVDSDSTIIKYSTNGAGLDLDTNGTAVRGRFYIGGYGSNLLNPLGSTVVKQYATCVFKPGTRIRWEPACSFNTSGRVVCAFTDNPEVMAVWAGLTDNTTKLDFIQSFGNTRTFPIWQETEIPFPTATRRKRFSTNLIPVVADVNENERSTQVLFMYGISGGPASTNQVGRFWFHDVVHVEGLIPSNVT